MAKLQCLPSRLTPLRSGLGSLAPVERSKSQERQLFAPWRKLYQTTRWRALRLQIFARDRFQCQWPGCGKVLGNTSLLVADHIQPHRGDESLFWDEANLQTLCKHCHDSHKQRAEHAARARNDYHRVSH